MQRYDNIFNYRWAYGKKRGGVAAWQRPPDVNVMMGIGLSNKHFCSLASLAHDVYAWGEAVSVHADALQVVELGGGVCGVAGDAVYA